jgi:hypothetical protein
MTDINRRDVLRNTAGLTGLSFAQNKFGESFVKRSGWSQASDSTPIELDAEPQQKWTYTIGGEIRDYVVSGGNVFIGTKRGGLHLIGTNNGQRIDRVDLSDSLYPGGLAQTGRYVVAATKDNQLNIFSVAQDGTLTKQWNPYISGRLSGLDARDNKVCVASRNTISIFNLESRELEVPSKSNNDHGFGRLAPPVVWTDSGIWVGDNECVAKFSHDLEIEYTHRDFDCSLTSKSLNITPRPDVAQTDRFMAISTINHVGGHVIFAIDKLNNNVVLGGIGGPASVGITDKFVASYNSGTVNLWDHRLENKIYSLPFRPQMHGIDCIADRMFISNKQGSNNNKSRIICVNNSNFQEIWSTGAINENISRMSSTPTQLFGINKKAGKVVSFYKSQVQDPSPGPIPGEEGEARFSLTTSDTAVPVGSTTEVTLSVINTLSSDDLTIQLILDHSSGLSIQGFRNIDEGSTQSTLTTTVPAGEEANLGMTVAVNELDEHELTGGANYFFGENSDQPEQFVQTLRITGIKGDSGPTPESPSSPESGTPPTTTGDGSGFGALLGLGSILGAAGFLRYLRESEDRE